MPTLIVCSVNLRAERAVEVAVVYATNATHTATRRPTAPLSACDQHQEESKRADELVSRAVDTTDVVKLLTPSMQASRICRLPHQLITVYHSMFLAKLPVSTASRQQRVIDHRALSTLVNILASGCWSHSLRGPRMKSCGTKSLMQPSVPQYDRRR